MKEALHFNFDGVSSINFGVISVNVSGGFLEESFLPSRNIRETKIQGRDKPYYSGVDTDPLQFSLDIYFESGFSNGKLREVARWLYTDIYKPMYFSTNTNRIFYCMAVGQPTLHHNGAKQGYVTIEFRCDSPFSYTPVFELTELEINGTNQLTLINDAGYSLMDGTFINTTIESGSLVLDVSETTWGDINSTETWGDFE